MDLYSPIFTRRSVRNYDMEPLDEEVISEMERVLSEVQPLVPGVELTHRIAGPDEVKGLGVCKAPHYLMISGKEQPLRNTCAGFLFQHAELYLYSAGFATRWLNGIKPKQPDPNHIIGIAFGRPAVPATRTLAEFDRKPLEEIAQGTDERLGAVRLAPSGMNGQPWYFIVAGDMVHVYYKESLGGMMGRFYHMTNLDVGIALCHMAVASDHLGRRFAFTTEQSDHPQPPEGFTYIGTVG